MKFKTLAAGALAATMLCGCASIFNGGPQKIDIASTPDGANVTITDRRDKVVFNGTTPATAELTRGDGFFSSQLYTVIVEKPGFAPQEVELRATANGWTFANLFLGGIVGIIIDGSTGAIFAYRPKDIDLTLAESGEASLKIIPMEALSDEEKENLIPIS